MPPHFGGPKKRRREGYNIDVKLVEIYEDLASEKDEIRLKAAQSLVSQFTPDQNPTDEQIKKVLQRLFRGLCSSRKAARIGFSIALTEVLTQVYSTPRDSAEFKLSDALQLWQVQTHASGGETGQVSWPQSNPQIMISLVLMEITNAGTTRPPLRTSIRCRGDY